jgi:uncharacterized membrane protein
MRIEERDQHTVHRLEAFSDIVIGFCMAQVGLNFALPKGAPDVTAIWTNANFFLVSFFVIALLWWLHHRTFSTLFVLMPLTVGLNFALLASLVLSLYFLQVFIHAAQSGQNPLVFLRLWIGSYLIVYALMGCLMLVGVVIRRGTLPTNDLRWTVGRLVVIALSVVVFGYLTFSGFAAHPHDIVSLALAWALLMALTGRVLVPQLLRRIIPDE